MTRIHKVMNCKDFDEKKFVPGSFGSPKVDGVRAFFYPTEPYLLSRDNKPLRGFDHIIQIFRDHGVLDTVDMEIWIPRMANWNVMAGAIRNHSLVPNARASILDIPSHPLNFIDRLHGVYTLSRMSKFFDAYHQVRLTTVDEVHELYRRAIEASFEGLVVKTPDHRYRDTRSYDWMRMVPIHSEDCKVLGVYEGKGKMAYIAGGLFIDFKGIRCKVGTMKGMTYGDRAELWENQDKYIGMTCEVEYKELQPSGKPRQPRFKGWRYDK